MANYPTPSDPSVANCGCFSPICANVSQITLEVFGLTPDDCELNATYVLSVLTSGGTGMVWQGQAGAPGFKGAQVHVNNFDGPALFSVIVFVPFGAILLSCGNLGGVAPGGGESTCSAITCGGGGISGSGVFTGVHGSCTGGTANFTLVTTG